jgi:hypothetical protein
VDVHVISQTLQRRGQLYIYADIKFCRIINANFSAQQSNKHLSAHDEQAAAIADRTRLANPCLLRRLKCHGILISLWTSITDLQVPRSERVLPCVGPNPSSIVSFRVFSCHSHPNDNAFPRHYGSCPPRAQRRLDSRSLGSRKNPRTVFMYHSFVRGSR